MDFSTSLKITSKGQDEIRDRTHKLGVRKRSILLMLERPRSIQYIVGRSVIPQGEVMAEIHALIAELFVVAGAGAAPEKAQDDGSPTEPAPDGSFHLDSGIILSEAKFLLVDFCVDSFGTHA